MIEIDIARVRVAAVKAVRLVVACRTLAKPVGLDTPDLKALETEFRDAAGELQRVEKLMKEDRNRPLIGGGEGS